MATTDGDLHSREQARLIKQHVWDPTLEPGFEKALIFMKGRPVPNYEDPEYLKLARNPGPAPPAEDGVTWTETTIPNIAGDHQIPIRVYRPDKPDALKPGFVLYYGGGLSVGHLNAEHTRAVELARSCGAVGISVDYRKAPEHPPRVILDDCYSALKYVNDNAADFGINPRRIVITGSSSGGLLTHAIALMARDRKDTAPLLQISIYPMTDVGKPPEYASRRIEYPILSQKGLDAFQRNVEKHGENNPYIWPNKVEDLSGQCPVFIVVAENDALRDEGMAYAWRLMKAGVQTQLHAFPGVPHGFDILGPSKSKTMSWELMTEAFKQAVARSDGQ